MELRSVRTPDPTMTGKVVLLIEADADARKRVAEILEDARYYVIAVSEAESAMLGFEYMAPDAVLVAYPIGNRAADDVPAMVRASSRPATPVIAMFPFPSRRIALQALDDGCADVIAKPIDRLLLVELLREVLEKRGARRNPDRPGDVRLVS